MTRNRMAAFLILHVGSICQSDVVRMWQRSACPPASSSDNIDCSKDGKQQYDDGCHNYADEEPRGRARHLPCCVIQVKGCMSA